MVSSELHRVPIELTLEYLIIILNILLIWIQIEQSEFRKKQFHIDVELLRRKKTGKQLVRIWWTKRTGPLVYSAPSKF